MLQSLLSPIPTLEQLATILIKRRENWGIRLKSSYSKAITARYWFQVPVSPVIFAA